MKQNDIIDIDVNQLNSQNLENLFNIFETDDNEYFYNITKSVHFPEDLSPYIYIDYVVTPKDTWPLISWKAYKNVKLWWLLCALNHIENPVEPLNPGVVIKVLQPAYVKDILSQIRNT
jgi:LysM repeat protein